MWKRVTYWFTKAQYILLIGAFLAVIMLCASKPYVISQENICVDRISDYPEINNQFEQLRENNSLIPSEYIVTTTVRSIWGECTFYLLPCYSISMNDVPENGNAYWNTSLFILSDCSNENSITGKLCRFSVHDVGVALVVDDHTLISTLVEVSPGNITYDTWGNNSVDLHNSFSLTEVSPLCVSFLASTSGNVKSENHPVIGRLVWDYSISCNGLEIATYKDIEIQQAYLVNAQ